MEEDKTKLLSRSQRILAISASLRKAQADKIKNIKLESSNLKKRATKRKLDNVSEDDDALIDMGYKSKQNSSSVRHSCAATVTEAISPPSKVRNWIANNSMNSSVSDSFIIVSPFDVVDPSESSQIAAISTESTLMIDNPILSSSTIVDRAGSSFITVDSAEVTFTVVDSTESALAIVETSESALTVKNLVASALTVEDLAESALTIEDLAESALTVEDLAESALTVEDLAESALTVENQAESALDVLNLTGSTLDFVDSADLALSIVDLSWSAYDINESIEVAQNIVDLAGSALNIVNFESSGLDFIDPVGSTVKAVDLTESCLNIVNAELNAVDSTNSPLNFLDKAESAFFVADSIKSSLYVVNPTESALEVVNQADSPFHVVDPTRSPLDVINSAELDVNVGSAPNLVDPIGLTLVINDPVGVVLNVVIPASSSFDVEQNTESANQVSEIQSSPGGSMLPSSKIRKRKPKQFTRVVRKQMQFEKEKASHPVQIPCGDKCRRKCSSKFNENQRVSINKEFWNMSRSERNLYILQSTKRGPVSGTSHDGASRRKMTFFYFLVDSLGQVISVCKWFFLTTLGFTKNNNSTVQHVLSETKLGSIIPKTDMRGKAPSTKKVDRNLIISHIEQFNPCISHYRREHAPNTRYLPSDITIESMHKDFLTRHSTVTCSYELYRTVVKKLKISFTKLGHEECEQCEFFNLHNSLHKKDSLDADCPSCKLWSNHIQKATASREAYERDKQINVSEDAEHRFFSADLQKVIMLPRMESFKTVIFTRRIVAFNESFVPLGKLDGVSKPFAAVWHEGVSGRKKEDIISAFHTFLLHHRDVNKITIWLDNCSAQNKNWAFFSFLIYIVNSSEISAESIELKFFEPGHTFMSADSFHHAVEQSMKRKGKVYDFNDFVDVVQDACRGRVSVKSLTTTDFSDWLDYMSTYKINKTKPRPYLADMVVVKATRGKNILHYQTDFDLPFIDLNFLNAKNFKQGIKRPERKIVPRGIPKDKKDDIIAKLLNLMPENRRKFWLDMHVDHVSDLTVDAE